MFKFSFTTCLTAFLIVVFCLIPLISKGQSVSIGVSFKAVPVEDYIIIKDVCEDSDINCIEAQGEDCIIDGKTCAVLNHEQENSEHVLIEQND